MTIRPIAPADYPQLEDFLYHAIHVAPGETLPPREVIFTPDIHIYIKDFGQLPADCGVLAEQDGTIIGMAWARIIPAYGNIDAHTPELAISVLPDYRGQGVGARMMQSLFTLLREQGHTRTSLSVQRANPAARFYQRLGYEVLRENAELGDLIMVKDLTKENMT